MRACQVPEGRRAIAARAARADCCNTCAPNASIESSENSAIMSSSRRTPTSLQLIRDRMSPRASIGLRELAWTMASTSSFSTPPLASRRCGIQVPSSNTELASAEKPRPPTSMVWQVEANRATGWPPRNTGVTTTKSNRWPVPSQGSLVMNTSPASIEAKGKRCRKWPTAIAMVLTCPGVPVTACANMRPWVSYTPADRSPASRATEPNAVRKRAWACSSTTEIRRFHITWVWIASNMLLAAGFMGSPPSPGGRWN